MSYFKIAIHVHDDLNDRLLEAHQETNQMARDTIVFGVLCMILIKQQVDYAYMKTHIKMVILNITLKILNLVQNHGQKLYSYKGKNVKILQKIFGS